MKIIVGLGNPGAQYENTPHSVGFEAVNKIAAAIGAEWEFKRKYNCLVATGMFAGAKTMLLKPQTFMNLSGEAVAPIVKYNNASEADLIVLQDDIDLPVGKLRIRKGGSCGGHNGIRNIIERLGSNGFTRVKMGVGKDKSDVISYVLGKFAPETRKIIDVVVEAAVKATEAIVRDGVERAMNAYNGFDAAAKKDI